MDFDNSRLHTECQIFHRRFYVVCTSISIQSKWLCQSAENTHAEDFDSKSFLGTIEVFFTWAAFYSFFPKLENDFHHIWMSFFFRNAIEVPSVVSNKILT